jgi:site-specific DNA recombinase
MDATIWPAAYGRVSSDKQAEALTIDSQVAALRRRIADDGLKLDDELCFLDEGYSGHTLIRPALEKLRDVAHCGCIDRLYVHSPDRLARKYAYQVLLLEEFGKCGVEVVFLNDLQQERSPEGELLVQMQGVFAEYERAKILERSRRGRRFAARQGKVSVLSGAPYGYRYVRRQDGGGEARYEVRPEDARVVQEIFIWVALEGLSLADVVRRLAERGVPSPTGNSRWERTTIRDILRHSAYAGVAKYGKTRLVPRENQRRPKRGDPPIPRQEKVGKATAPSEQEDIPVPALISVELFTEVAAKLEENRRRFREQKKGSEFLLGGLLVCQRCGSAYCGRRHRRSGRQYCYYRCLGTDKYRHGGEAPCTNRSLRGDIDEAVWSDLCGLLNDPERLEREFNRRLAEPKNENVTGARLRESIGRLKLRISRLIDAYENGSVDKAEFQPRIQRAKEQLAREQDALAACEKEASTDNELRLVLGDFTAFAREMSKGLGHADFAMRRKLLRLLVNRIQVDDDEVRIVYKVQPRPFALGPGNGALLQDCSGRPLGPSGRFISDGLRYNGEREPGFPA